MRATSRATYKTFMKKYGIPLMIKENGKYRYKSMKQMQQQIYEYETYNDVITGLYYFYT